MADSLHLLLLQSPFDLQMPENWFAIIGDLLDVLYTLAIRGFMIFVLIGLMIFATGISDGLSKGLVAFGIILYFVGPYVVNLFGHFNGFEPITIESATSAWLRVIGMTDVELISVLVWFGDAIVSLCLLTGAVLYFTPSAKDLEARGRSLIVRALMFAPILAFFHIVSWL
ncbi:MAG: hypothetical protein ACXABH_07555 [Candidatus Thorarchaeota archaeon]